MTVHPSAMNTARTGLRRMWPKREPRQRKPKKVGESRTRRIVAERSGGVCELCGVRPAESVHHRWKKGQGGPWSPSNCVATCGDGTRGCHGWIESHPGAAGVLGFHLRPKTHPSKVSISSALHGVVLLIDDGGISPVPAEGGTA